LLPGVVMSPSDDRTSLWREHRTVWSEGLTCATLQCQCLNYEVMSMPFGDLRWVEKGCGGEGWIVRVEGWI